MTETQDRCLDVELCVPGLVRRARRTADLSQRDLAAALGVSQSMVARWETGRSVPCLALLARLLRLAGLRLVVEVAGAGEDAPAPEVGGEAVAPTRNEVGGTVDRPPALACGSGPGDGPLPEPSSPTPRSIATPMRTDALRDHGGRRYPAHLDVHPVPWAWYPRSDRRESDLVYHLRPERDRRRLKAGLVPDDHPTRAEVQAEFGRRRVTAALVRKLRTGPLPEIEEKPCTCPIECFETYCVPGCPCGCESYETDFDAA